MPAASPIDALFTPAAIAARIVPVPGARNLRDMGGYPTADGRQVKRATLFRSGHPGDIAADDLGRLHALGLRGHVDLRTTGERRALAFPAAMAAAAGCWARDYAHSGGDLTTTLRDPASTGEAMRARMIDLYRGYPAEQREGIGATFRLLLGGHVPLLINCTAGKDRTGIVCALLLCVLGVPREIVRRDYALTEVLHDPAGPLFALATDSPYVPGPEVPGDVWHALMRSDPAYLDAMFDTLDTDHGGVDTYLADAHGIGTAEIARLRALLLEDRARDRSM